jgi:hypothetical protein
MPRNRKLVYFLSCLVVIPALACGGGKKSSSSGGSGDTSGQPQSTQTSAQTDAAGKDFASFAAAFSKVKSFKATITSNPGSGPQTEATMEVQLPDRYHLTSSTFELISIGNDSYVKAGANWVKSASGGAGSLAQITQLAAAAAAIPPGQIAKGGTDTVNGSRCQLYTQTIGGASTEYCLANSLPLRIVITSSSSKSTILFTDYDKPVDIKAPI